MKTLNNVTGRLFLLVLLLGVCTLFGCGMREAKEETQVSEDLREEEREEPALSKSSADEEDSAEDSEQEEEESEAKGPITMVELLEEASYRGPKAGDRMPGAVLWFNATYALWSYTNGYDWNLIGGLETSPDTRVLSQALVEQEWNVVDKKSALEQLEWLENEGQRATFRQYQQELREKGLLNLNTDEFLETLMDTEMEGDWFQYYMVYTMYHDGRDEYAIAAWDLCRINQLCGQYYICRYLTYEEAMDISLETSRKLQKMYSSWDEMVGSYMLGYQFRQSDPCLTDDSPTLELYRYYEELLEMEDGPYSLNWDRMLGEEW